MHIHVLCDGKEAKYWLEPQVELAKNTGIPEHKLNEIQKIVEKCGIRLASILYKNLKNDINV